MSSSIILCDVCSNEIKVEKLKEYKDSFRYERVVIRSFECPSCGKEYIVSIDTKKSLKQKEKLKYLETAVSLKDNSDLPEDIKEYQKLKAEYKAIISKEYNKNKVRIKAYLRARNRREAKEA